MAKGIELVDVGGVSNGQFALSTPLKSGLREYRLYQHADGSWYLTNLDGSGTDDSGFTGGNSGNEIINNTIGGAVANQQAALNLFSEGASHQAREMATHQPDSNLWGYYKFN